MECRLVLAGAAVTAILFAGYSAMAEQSVRPSSEPEAEGSKAQQQTGSSHMRSDADVSRRGWKHIRGEVERVKRVALRGGPEGDHHLVALVTGGMGHRMIVDLGPARQYRSVPVMSGEEIAVHGPIGWISDRKVLLAQRVSINGEKIKVTRDRSIDPRQLDRRAAQGEDRSVTGQIEHAKELRLRGIERQHLVVRLKTQEGRQILADLGSPQDLTRVSLEAGRSITVEGPAIHVSGKPLILARQVTAEGKTVQIDRDIRSVMPAMLPGSEPAAGRQRQASAQPSPP